MKDLRNLEGLALSYQPRLLDILFDRMPMGIAILDRELRVRRFNPTWAKYVVRYSPGSTGRIVPGVSLLELTPGNEATVRAVFEPVLAGEQVHQEDFRLEIGGITSYWDAVITPIIENGKVVGILHVITDMTERKQAEEALQASERFRLLVMHIPDVIWTTDCKGRTTFIGPNVEQVYGFTPEEIYQAGSRLWLERIHPEDLEKVKEAYESLFTRNEMFDVEYRIQRKDGRWIWLHDRAIATYEKDGVMYADGMFSDITERVRAEEELRAERNFISGVLDTAGALVAVLNREGRIVRFNQACEEKTGYLSDEVRGKPLWDLFLIPEEVEPVKAVFEELRAGQFPSKYENYWVTKDGERRLIAWSNTAILDADGLVEYIIGTGIDITERKQAEEALLKARDELELRVEERTAELRRANESLKEQIAERVRTEEALRESEEKFRGIVEYGNVGIAIVQDARFRFVNPHYAGMLGYTVEELLDTEFTDYCTPEERDRIVDLHTRRMRGETVPPRYETAIRHKNGGRVYVDVSVRLIPYEGGSAAFVFLRDITEQKQAQEALQLAYQTLEKRVEERARELAALNAISAVVSRSLDLAEIMSNALDKTLEVMGMDLGVAYRLERGGDPSEHSLLNVMAHRGISTELARQVDPLPLRGSIIEKAAAVEQPVVWQVADYPSVALKQAMEEEGVRLGVSVPLLVKERLVGALVLAARDMRTFVPEELSLLAAIGQQIGIAVENARLYEQAEQAAVITERNRLARELHDSVTQALYSVTLYAEAAAILLADGKNLEAADHLRELRDTAQEALREMRLLIFELRPLALEKTGLVAALQTRLEAVEGRGGMQTELQVEGAPNAERLPFAVQEELYHIAQEALNNVLKHARAQRVRVHLQFFDTVTCLEVWDDGVGFESERARERGGLGLRGMEERAQRIGGKLHIESAPGKGTRVSIKVPTGSLESLEVHSS
jgi:PAS domain S-box-containing protein